MSVSGSTLAIERAARFAEVAKLIDIRARAAGRSLPTYDENQSLVSTFWQLVEAIGRGGDANEVEVDTRQEVRDLVNPWLLRSRFWCRAWLKPNGHPGDFELLEWTYDLEGDPCMNPAQPAVVNALDALFASLGSVAGAWYRRAWCRDLMVAMIDDFNRPIRVLDIVCNGSRYTRDALRIRPGFIRFSGVDEDPAAIGFVRSRLPADALDRVGLRSASIDRVPELVPVPTWPEAGFDLVVATTVFDDLDDAQAPSLLEHMRRLTRPGGSTAICNSSPRDRSRIVKEWFSDWPTVARSASALRDLFPVEDGLRVVTADSPNGAVVCARAVK